MNFKQFIQEIKETVKEALGEKIVVEEKEVLKNNGVRLTGIVIVEGNANCVPNIYLNDYYKQYKNGRGIDDIVCEIFKFYEYHKIEKHMNMDFFSDYECVKSKLRFRLVNFARNTELLTQIPYVPYLDLAIVFYCMVENECIGNGSILIRNEHLEKWKISKEILKKDAFLSTQLKIIGEIKPMEDVIFEMIMRRMTLEIQNSARKHMDANISISDDIVEPIVKEMMDNVYSEDKGPKMYVLSNESKTFGASAILYQNLLSEFANKTQSDYYILPSSIHEVILIPIKEDDELLRLKNMVYEVNRTEMETEEILSDCVYIFKRSEGEIKIAL